MRSIYESNLLLEWLGDLFAVALANREVRRSDLVNGEAMPAEQIPG